MNWFALADDVRAVRVKESPGRQVWRVELRGKVYFAKVLKPRGWSDRCRRLLRGSDALAEWAALEYAREYEVAAVRGVACGECGRDSVLVTEGVADAVSLCEAWSRADRRDGLIRSTAKLFATAHESGFVHRDGHPGNLLVQIESGCEPQVMFVDLYGARTGIEVSDRAAARSLAQLDQWFVRRASRAQRLRFLRWYLESRFGDAPKPSSIRRWAERISIARARWSRRLALRRDRRWRRSGKYFAPMKSGSWRGVSVLRLRDGGGIRRLQSTGRTEAEWADLCTTITRSLAAGGSPDQGHDLQIDRRRAKGLFEAIAWSIARSTAQRMFCVGHRLRHRNIVCAPPIVYLDRRSCGITRECLLGFERQDEIRPIDSWCAERADWPRVRAWESVGRWLAEAEAVGLVWPDPDPEAFRWTEDGRAVLVRFEGMFVRRSGVGRISERGATALAERMHLCPVERSALIQAYRRRRSYL